MKRYLLAVVLVVACAAPAMAANFIGITGDPARDGNLMIDITWKIDTAKYKGLTPDAIRESVYQEIWKELLPKLVKTTEGYPVSFEKSNFSKLSEQKQLVEQRADGTKVVDYFAKVKFHCPRAEGAAAPQHTKAASDEMDKQFSYRFVREVRDY